MRRVLWSLRNSTFDKENYQRLVDLWETARLAEPSPLIVGGEWMCVIERFNLDDVTPLTDWVGFIASVEKLGWASPAKSAKISEEMISQSIPDGPENSKLFSFGGIHGSYGKTRRPLQFSEQMGLLPMPNN